MSVNVHGRFHRIIVYTFYAAICIVTLPILFHLYLCPLWYNIQTSFQSHSLRILYQNNSAVRYLSKCTQKVLVLLSTFIYTRIFLKICRYSYLEKLQVLGYNSFQVHGLEYKFLSTYMYSSSSVHVLVLIFLGICT